MSDILWRQLENIVLLVKTALGIYGIYHVAGHTARNILTTGYCVPVIGSAFLSWIRQHPVDQWYQL